MMDGETESGPSLEWNITQPSKGGKTDIGSSEDGPCRPSPCGEARPKRPHGTGFPVYDTFRAGQSPGAESRGWLQRLSKGSMGLTAHGAGVLTPWAMRVFWN